jgi:hypothetical protein
VSARALRLLGTGAVVAAPPRPAQDDPELASAGVLTPARTLAGLLGTAPAGMSRWPRFDRYGRAVAAVVDRTLATRPRQPAGMPTGLYLVSELGCFETNAVFHRGLIEKGPRLASPLLFPYTVPGAAAAEAALHFGLTDEYLVFSGGPWTALCAVLAAADALELRPELSLVVATADVLGPETLAAHLAGGALEPALPLAEGAAGVWLRDARAEGLGPLCAVEGAVGPGDPNDAAVRRLADEALARAGVRPPDLGQVLSATVSAERRTAELTALDGLAPRVALTQLAFRLGDCGASLGLLALLAAVEDGVPALVLAAGRGGSAALVVVPETSTGGTPS